MMKVPFPLACVLLTIVVCYDPVEVVMSKLP